MGHQHAQKYMPQFVCYLRDKNLLQDGQIKKETARAIYFQEFKQLFGVQRLPFSQMFSNLKYFGIIRYVKEEDAMIFEENFLKEITPDGVVNKKNKGWSKKSLSAKSSKTSVHSIRKQYECAICKIVYATEIELNSHLQTDSHKTKTKVLLKDKANSNLDLFAEVKADFRGGPEIVIVRPNEPEVVFLKLVNCCPDDYSVISIEQLYINSNSSLVSLRNNCPFTLYNNSKLALPLDISLKESIFWHCPFIFKMKNCKTAEQTEVLKELLLHCHSPLLDDLLPKQPYQKSTIKFAGVSNDEEIVPGVPPESNNDTGYHPVFALPQYRVPDPITVLLNSNFKRYKGIPSHLLHLLDDIQKLFERYEKVGTLDQSSYFKQLQLCLMMEEHQMYINIRAYDADNQTLTSVDGQGFNKCCLELKVPGLAEHRPSLLRGDRIYVKETRNSKVKFEGIIHKVNLDGVIVGFNRRFVNEVYIPNNKYFVSFSFNRLPLRVENQALELSKSHKLIPQLCTTSVKTNPAKDIDFSWFDKNIGNNEKQQQAVRHIVSQTSKPMPYLIFGPPGTGKTVTIVESVLQIWSVYPENRTLICTPSNSAANELTKRLIKRVPKRHLLRYIAPSYPFDDLDPEIKAYTNHNLTGYYHPSVSTICSYRIVVSTLVNSWRMVNGGLPENHFNYVFIDESGQATETETLIPIAGILTRKKSPGLISGQIVLAGDPKQLGPLIHSRWAEKYGFGISMLERFMTSNPIYTKKHDKYNNFVLTKLVKSYRSHPAILDLPNKLFYEGELVAAGDVNLTNCALSWSELPNKQFPVLFHSILGKDEQEANSPSFFNLQEVSTILVYLEKLLGSRLSGLKITPRHIGIITPYRKQVEKLRKACAKKNWTLDIGSVEQFQGQERLITIVSTVRTRPELTKHDEKFHLGFLKNAKRFNVATTRAKALLIVVGNPKILQFDQQWRAFIEYCKENRSCVGAPFDLTSLSVESIAPGVASALGNYDGSPSFARGIV